MKNFIKKHSWYFTGLVVINAILLICLFFAFLFSQFPVLYQNFQRAFSSGMIRETFMSFVEYLKFYAVQVGASFILAFPIGAIIWNNDFDLFDED